LFVVKDASAEYEIFRRYLFDWRTSLHTPFALLLNGDGEAVKVYGAMPSPTQVDADLALLRSGKRPNALPFDGFFAKQPKRDYFKFGAAYLWAGMVEPAVPYLQRVLEQTPDNARVLVLMGQIQLETSHVTEAAESFTKAARIDGGAVNAFIGLGDVAAKSGNSANAATEYGKALELDPRSPEAANGLGLALAKLGRPQEAQEYFEKAIAARRDYADAINNLGVLYMQQGKPNDAIAAWTYGIRMTPDEDILYLNLGRAYVSMGQNEKARLTMQQLLDRDSNNQTARRALQELSGR
jgi:tetratricopeptide (TPR) repeat protein